MVLISLFNNNNFICTCLNVFKYCYVTVTVQQSLAKW